ncbi:hypothetical protein BROC_02084 [Candidatus Brocadiaceae bacterium]|nr:hypothetical protein BROC_02084 [Candidatus Brocadiaceae bacterium]
MGAVEKLFYVTLKKVKGFSLYWKYNIFRFAQNGKIGTQWIFSTSSHDAELREMEKGIAGLPPLL